MRTLPAFSRPLQAKLTLGLSALALTVACGGGAGSSAPKAAAPAQPAPKAQKDPAAEPFWASDNPLRPNAPKALNAPAAGSGVVVSQSAVQLDRDELAVLASRQGLRLAEATPAAPGVNVPVRIVTGLRSFTYHTDAATGLQPLDLSATTISAMVPNAAGGFDTITGQGHSDGTFSIAGVPEGWFWLKFGTQYLWTNASFIDWSNDTFGRMDVEYPGNPTVMTLNATNLAAWQDSDSLQWTVVNHGIAYPIGSPVNPPAAGATSLANYGFDFANESYPLLDATKGDQAYLNQLTTRAAGAEHYLGLAKSFALPALTMTDGTAVTVNGGFLDLAQASTVRLALRRSQYETFRTLVNPNASVTYAAFNLWAYPQGTAYGVASDAFNLMSYDNSTSPTTDVDLGDLSYGNPYPNTWPLVAEGYAYYRVNFLAPGAVTPVGLSRSCYTATTTLPSSAAPFSQAVGPIQNPRINGKDFFATALSVGASPTLTWSAPSVGAVSGYVVRVQRLFADGPNSRMQSVALLRTRATSLAVPPGILQAGNTYVLTIAAVRAGSTDYNTTPFKTTLPYASMTTIGGIVVP